VTLADKYWYTFRSSDGHVVKVLRGETPPKATDGMGGWTIVARSRRTAFTQWDGRNPYAMDVPILFDGYASGTSVEGDISKLFQMGVGSDFSPPPTVTVDGAVPIKGAKWVINNIDWGDEVIWQQQGKNKPYRLRQDAIVHLVEYEAEKRVKILTTHALPNVYVTNPGDTMRSIAKLWYGDATLWTAIKNANPKIRDPNNIPKHTHLRIP
jgi:hypothetical protein